MDEPLQHIYSFQDLKYLRYLPIRDLPQSPHKHLTIDRNQTKFLRRRVEHRDLILCLLHNHLLPYTRLEGHTNLKLTPIFTTYNQNSHIATRIQLRNLKFCRCSDGESILSARRSSCVSLKQTSSSLISNTHPSRNSSSMKPTLLQERKKGDN